jgi:hypothetical protein
VKSIVAVVVIISLIAAEAMIIETYSFFLHTLPQPSLTGTALPLLFNA